MHTNLAKVKPTNCIFLRNTLPFFSSWNPNYKLVKVALNFLKLSWAFASWLGLIVTMLMFVMMIFKRIGESDQINVKPIFWIL